MQIEHKSFEHALRFQSWAAALERFLAMAKSLCCTQEIRVAFLEFAALTLGTLFVPAALMLDLLVFKNGVSELSVTELSQEALVLSSAIVFGIKAHRHAEDRGLLTLMSGFFACLFVRELDCFFDLIVYHGFWVWLVFAIAVVSVGYTLSSQAPFWTPLRHYIGTRSQLLVAVGLLVVIGLSRVMGSGHLIWRHVFSSDMAALLKNSLQEALELFGYLLVFFGACIFRHSPSTARE